jgi:hypothetical protein
MVREMLANWPVLPSPQKKKKIKIKNNSWPKGRKHTQKTQIGSISKIGIREMEIYHWVAATRS